MTERADLDRLIGELEPRVRRVFEAAVRSKASRIDLRALRDALARGDIEEAISIAAIEQRDVFTISEALRGAFFEAGSLVGRGRRGIIGTFQFDGRQQEALAWAQENSARLVTRLTEESRDAVRATITAGFESNRGAQSVARDIAGRRVGAVRVGSVVGLTGPQADSIARARIGLATGDTAALRRYLTLKLRDKRLDGIVRRALRDGRAVSAADLDKLTEAHKAKALGYRGKVIAQAETFKAAAAGRDEAYRQMLGMDGVTGVTVRWQHNLSAEPREEHIAMSGTVIRLGESFIFPDGTAMRHPHDENAPARHVIGCKCVAIYRVEVAKD